MIATSSPLEPLHIRRALISVSATAATLGVLLSLMPSTALAVPSLSPVRKVDLSSSALVGGVVVPEKSTSLYFSPALVSAGAGRTRRVKAVHVRTGQAVSKGTVLAELDGDDLFERLDEAKNALSRAQQAQRQAEAARKAQESRIAQLTQELVRARDNAQQASAAAGEVLSECATLAASLVETALAESASLPPSPWPPSLDSMPRTKAALGALQKCQSKIAESSTSAGASAATEKLLEAQLSSLSSSKGQEFSASSQVSAARRNVDQIERLIEGLTLSAPYDGVVTRVNVRAATNLQAGIPAFEFRTSQLVARADLAEGDLLGVKPGAVAHISIRAARTDLTSTVEAIAEDPRGSEGGPVSYPAYFDLPSNEAIKPGQLVKVKVIVETRKGVLAVPSSAVTERKGLYYVVVVKDGREEPRRVVPGLSDETFTEIVQGLEEGEMVRTLAPRL